MNESTLKEKVLKKVRDALVNGMPPPYEGIDNESPVFFPPEASDLDIIFAESFSQAQGKFIFCSGLHELASSLVAVVREKGLHRIYCAEGFFRELLDELGIFSTQDAGELRRCEAAVTGCEVLVARLGSVVVSSRQGGGRRGFFQTPVHMVIASIRQLVPDISDAFRFIQARYGEEMPSMISFITGPSRTADIEKTLVHGAHGPSELYVFLVDTESPSKQQNHE